MWVMFAARSRAPIAAAATTVKRSIRFASVNARVKSNTSHVHVNTHNT